MTLFLSEADVKKLLTMPMCLEAVEFAHKELSLGKAIDVTRARTRLPQTTLHMLQGALSTWQVMGYKAYTSNRSGNRFFVHLFDTESGKPKAVIEANYLGMMRTGAASGVAAKWLARKDSQIAGVFGTGWQARGHIQALCAALPLQKVKVFGRDQEKLKAFCAEMQAETGVSCEAMKSAEDTVRDSDIIGTVTSASLPLFEADWLKKGAHINAAGSNALIRAEISEAVLRLAMPIVVDTISTALAEAGDLLPLFEKGRLHVRQLIELGDIIIGRQAGRENQTQITLFESQGMAIQDLAVAKLLLDAAEKAGIGSALPY